MDEVYYMMGNIKPKLRKPSQCWKCHGTHLIRINRRLSFKCATCGNVL